MEDNRYQLNKQLALAFHPELENDVVHRYFIDSLILRKGRA